MTDKTEEKIEENKNPVTPSRAYLLLRTDLPSLGNGKGKAHAMHAGNHMTWELVVKPLSAGKPVDQDVITWHEEGKGFGTTIALGGPGEITLQVLEGLVNAANKLGMKAGAVVDPEYPYHVDSEMLSLIDPKLHSKPPVRTSKGWLCLRKEVTAAWLFGKPEELAILVGRYGLAPE